MVDKRYSRDYLDISGEGWNKHSLGTCEICHADKNLFVQGTVVQSLRTKTYKPPGGNLVLKQNTSLLSAASCSTRSQASFTTSDLHRDFLGKEQAP